MKNFFKSGWFLAILIALAWGFVSVGIPHTTKKSDLPHITVTRQPLDKYTLESGMSLHEFPCIHGKTERGGYKYYSTCFSPLQNILIDFSIVRYEDGVMFLGGADIYWGNSKQYIEPEGETELADGVYTFHNSSYDTEGRYTQLQLVVKGGQILIPWFDQ